MGFSLKNKSIRGFLVPSQSSKTRGGYLKNISLQLCCCRVEFIEELQVDVPCLQILTENRICLGEIYLFLWLLIIVFFEVILIILNHFVPLLVLIIQSCLLLFCERELFFHKFFKNKNKNVKNLNVFSCSILWF